MTADVDVRVRYRFTSELSDQDYAASLAALTPEEQARHDRFLFERDRRDFAAAHALLHEMLAAAGLDETGWTFVRGTHGKPAVVFNDGRPAPVAFNLAHTRGLVACATAAAAPRDPPELGVDVEPIRIRDWGQDIAARFFCPGEVSALGACGEASRATRFTELWTLKESYIKAIGLGLSCPLHSFAFRFVGDAGLAFESPEGVPVYGWQFGLYAPEESYRLAVAVRSAGAPALLEVKALDTGSSLEPIRAFTDRG